MFHEIKEVKPLPNLQLIVQFREGVTKRYDLLPLLKKIAAFRRFERQPELFWDARVDIGGAGIVWDDELDLSSDELWDNGVPVSTPFDGLMSLADATAMWGLSESALRKAIAYGKLVDGVDVRKYGKQWVVCIDAMEREYGQPE